MAHENVWTFTGYQIKEKNSSSKEDTCIAIFSFMLSATCKAGFMKPTALSTILFFSIL